jgi:hypothetical protein
LLLRPPLRGGRDCCWARNCLLGRLVAIVSRQVPISRSRPEPVCTLPQPRPRWRSFEPCVLAGRAPSGSRTGARPRRVRVPRALSADRRTTERRR